MKQHRRTVAGGWAVALLLAALGGAQEQAVAPDYLMQGVTEAEYLAQPDANAMVVWKGPSVGGIGVPADYTNPVLPGTHPSPSLCRVDRTYYLVTGTTRWYPGLPLYRSRDLVNWEPLGHALTRPSQCFVHDRADVWWATEAPCLRHHDGTFYLTATARIGEGFSANFYVTATDPAGPWSDPIWLAGPGVHPALCFDRDGTAWVVTRAADRRGGGLYLSRLNLARRVLEGPVTTLARGRPGGSQRLYWIDDDYVLLATQGRRSGVRAYRAERVTGPYRPWGDGPVIPAAGSCGPVTGIGCPDLVVTHHREVWGLVEARRRVGPRSPLGPETFLVPLRLSPQGLVLDANTPEIPRTHTRPNLGWHVAERLGPRDDFARGRLHARWTLYRAPGEPWWSCLDRTGWLRLQLPAAAPTSLHHSGLVVQPVTSPRFQAALRLDFRPQADTEQAGLIVLRDPRAQVRLALAREAGATHVELWQVKGGVETRLAARPVKPGPVRLAVAGDGVSLRFSAGPENDVQRLGEPVSLGILVPPGNANRNGIHAGVFATSQGAPSDTVADVDWFELAPLP